MPPAAFFGSGGVAEGGRRRKEVRVGGTFAGERGSERARARFPPLFAAIAGGEAKQAAAAPSPPPPAFTGPGGSLSTRAAYAALAREAAESGAPRTDGGAKEEGKARKRLERGGDAAAAARGDVA